MRRPGGTDARPGTRTGVSEPSGGVVAEDEELENAHEHEGDAHEGGADWGQADTGKVRLHLSTHSSVQSRAAPQITKMKQKLFEPNESKRYLQFGSNVAPTIM